MPGDHEGDAAEHPPLLHEIERGSQHYEVSCYDSDGRRRWKTIDGGLREAEATLDDLRSRVRGGERVAPTKATVREVAEVWLASKSSLGARTRQMSLTRVDHGDRTYVLGLVRDRSEHRHRT